MKALLTSSGIKNGSINDALVDLLGKPIADCNALFVPTGIYPFPGGAGAAWRAISGKSPSPMCGLGWKSLGVLELTALPHIDEAAWVPTLRDIDALLVWGGKHRRANSRVLRHAQCGTRLSESGHCDVCGVTPGPEDLITERRRGYRPTGHERSTRILALHTLRKTVLTETPTPVRVRLCATPLGLNPRLAGLKTLNRLESVLARAEWHDARIWEGLMRDVDENIVCGTMSNLFLRRGSTLMTPVLDRCGVAGVMRRWILEAARELRLKPVERRLRWQDLSTAEEAFMSNAVVGVRSVAVIERRRERLRHFTFETANRLRARLDLL